MKKIVALILVCFFVQVVSAENLWQNNPPRSKMEKRIKKQNKKKKKKGDTTCPKLDC